MKSIKETLDIIKTEFVSIFGEDIRDIRLEEIEKNSANNEYLLTVSFLIPNSNMPTLAVLSANPYTRSYKKVRINYNTGDITSIKIHKNE